jgi:hypothetical protein
VLANRIAVVVDEVVQEMERRAEAHRAQQRDGGPHAKPAGRTAHAISMRRMVAHASVPGNRQPLEAPRHNAMPHLIHVEPERGFIDFARTGSIP